MDQIEPQRDKTPSTEHLRQGDHINISLLPLVNDGDYDDFASQHGVVIVSQTCDVVRSTPQHILVAPLDFLEEPAASEARFGKRSRYVPVPQLGPAAFADLSVIASLDKSDPALREAVHGVSGDEEVRHFSRAIGRRFARFPFPDEVVPWFQPLQDIVRSKSRKESAPEGMIFAKVEELRVEASDGWIEAPYSLNLIVLLQPGELPALDDEALLGPPPGFAEATRDRKGNHLTSGQLAQILLHEKRPDWRYHLWLDLAQSWVAKCRPAESTLQRMSPGMAKATREAINGDIGYEVLMTDEYTYDRYRRSEELDLDHLSPPLPH